MAQLIQFFSTQCLKLRVFFFNFVVSICLSMRSITEKEREGGREISLPVIDVSPVCLRDASSTCCHCVGMLNRLDEGGDMSRI